MDTLTCEECSDEAEIVETKLEDGVDVRAICDCGAITKPDNDSDGPTSTSVHSTSVPTPDEQSHSETSGDPRDKPDEHDESGS